MLIDFWTYTCINCLRTLPNLRAWDARYRAAGLTIVGVHTPEFAFERGAANVADAVRGNRLRYPVVQDNAYGTWNAWRNQYWPAKYLVDARGRVRFWHFGEGGEAETEAAIRSLLAEAGRAPGDALAPERRVERAARRRHHAGDLPRLAARAQLRQSRTAAARLPSLRHRPWPVAAGRVRLSRRVDARARAGRGRAATPPSRRRSVRAASSSSCRSPGRARRIRVLVDGRPAPDALAGPDVPTAVSRSCASSASTACWTSGGWSASASRSSSSAGWRATPSRSAERAVLGCRAVDTIDELVANNRAFAAALPAVHLDVRPRRRLAVVTCMDSRLNAFAALGLGDGEAHILRNAGGVITDDVIRSLAVSQRRLGTREVMLIHHTDCGMQALTDDGFRAELQAATGVAPAFAIESFTDVEADVRQSILRVRRSPFIPHRDVVRGFVYDVDTHELREVHVEDAA